VILLFLTCHCIIVHLKFYNINAAGCVAKRIFCLPGDTVLIENNMGRNDGITRFQIENQLFPHDSSLHWTLEKYGPLYVPAKGDSIELTEKNKYRYAEILLLENSRTDKLWIMHGLQMARI